MIRMSAKTAVVDGDSPKKVLESLEDYSSLFTSDRHFAWYRSHTSYSGSYNSSLVLSELLLNIAKLLALNPCLQNHQDHYS
jgi:hypothetical protein